MAPLIAQDVEVIPTTIEMPPHEPRVAAVEAGTPRHCFAYGSLMCEEIMFAVAAARPLFVPARLDGYRRAPVDGEDYPGIVPAAGASVAGALYLELPDSAWPRLDGFEGEEYRREAVEVQLPDGRAETAWTYVFKPEYGHRLAAGEWDFAHFLRSGKARFEARYLGFARLEPDHRP